jgi:hypothetical protein
MAEIIPTIGRIVIYTLSADDAATINKRRADARAHMDAHRSNSNGVMVHVGNEAREGQEYPMLIVATRGGQPDSYVNGTVQLDGSDTFWATSRKVGTGPGTYHWMEYQKGQAAKTEKAEATALELGAEVRRLGLAGN